MEDDREFTTPITNIEELEKLVENVASLIKSGELVEAERLSKQFLRIIDNFSLGEGADDGAKTKLFELAVRMRAYVDSISSFLEYGDSLETEDSSTPADLPSEASLSSPSNAVAAGGSTSTTVPVTVTTASLPAPPAVATVPVPGGSTTMTVPATVTTASLPPPPALFRIESLTIPVYDGNPLDWRSFYEQFQSLVANSSFPTIQKLLFLYNHLSGSARQAIEGYSLSEANYDAILNTLVERFGSASKQNAVFYDELDRLTPASTAAGQRTNLDTVTKIVNNLKAGGGGVDEEFLKRKILSKFSRTTLHNVFRDLGSESSCASLDRLMSALSTAVRLDELADNFLSAGPSESSARPKLAAAFVTGSAPTNNLSSESSNNSCIFCKKTHRSQDCRKFSSFRSRRERLQTISCCFVCLKSGHTAGQCTRKTAKCSYCRKTGHPIALCVDLILSRRLAGNNDGPQPKPQPQRRDHRRKTGTFLETFSGCIENKNLDFLDVRGVFDSCSEHSYVTDSLLKKINLQPKKKTPLNLCVFGSAEPRCIQSGLIPLTLTSRNKLTSKTLPFMTTPCISGEMSTAPPASLVCDILPRNLAYADPEIFSDHKRPIEIIVGNDHQFEFFTGEIKRVNGVILRKSMFGWVPTGPVYQGMNLSSSCVLRTPILLSSVDVESNDDFSLLLNNLWSLDVLGIRSAEANNVDDFVLRNFRETVRFENNRFIVRWPWKSENPSLPSNFRMCMSRLKSLHQRSNIELLQKYDDVLKEQLALGIIEYAPKQTRYLTHYMPHRAILRNGKIRVVYDASAKTKTGNSLNELIHAGPVLLEDLVGLLLNFRLHPVALTADIEKAFLQIGLNEVDRDVVRFLWVKDISKPPSSENLEVFRFCRVPFGVIASPFLLNITLQELFGTVPNNEWCQLARRRFYVDNLVVSVRDTFSAINLYNSVFELLKSASFNLRDFTSNDFNFLRAINASPISADDRKVSILGVYWDRFQDTLSIKFDASEAPSSVVTKRSALKFYASIYDPLGFFGPCTLRLKLFIQDCWRNKYDWDSPLPPNFVARWVKLFSEARDILDINIPRLVCATLENVKVTLHVFCDASKDAYACAAYLAFSDPTSGLLDSVLIYAKTRAAPKPPVSAKTPPVGSKQPLAFKELSIPRLELMAVVIGKRAASFLTSKLDLKIDSTVLWTDATTILQWLNSSIIQPQFVQNRLSEIRRAPNLTIRHVPTEFNPADVATRGIRASLLTSLWWKGPNWLPCENLWPSTPDTTTIYRTPVLVLATSELKYTGILTDRFEKRFNSYNAYIRIFMYIFRFALMPIRSLPYIERYRFAEQHFLRELQHKYFGREFACLRKNIQPNTQIDLFLDDFGLIRCKGRLQNTDLPYQTIHPILLPRDSAITTLLLEKIHISNHHVGYTHMLALLREKFWIVKGGLKIKSILHKCVTCRHWSGGSYQLPGMPPLPLYRAYRTTAFVHIGVDYFGPLTIKNEAGYAVKAYGVLFVCLVTRAVHLEPARDKSGYEFLNCLSRFAARRGTPRFIISDNATTFTFIQPLLGDRVEIYDPRVRNYLIDNQIDWKFIPVQSPWYGGAYERLVANVKNALKKSYGFACLDYVEFMTALCRVESVINGRPLTYVSSDDLSSPLTPAHFANLRPPSRHIDIPERLPSTSENLIAGWRSITRVLESFWSVFSSQYLTSLRDKHVATHRAEKGSVPFEPRVGDVVLVKEPSMPRAEWRLAKILRLDKRKAIAFVKEGERTLQRPVNRLCPLEVPPLNGNKEKTATSNCKSNSDSPDEEIPSKSRRFI